MFTFLVDSKTDTVHLFREVQQAKPRKYNPWFTEGVRKSAVMVRKSLKRY